MFKYILWLIDKETSHSFVQEINAKNKTEALKIFRHKFQFQLMEYEDIRLRESVLRFLTELGLVLDKNYKYQIEALLKAIGENPNIIIILLKIL